MKHLIKTSATVIAFGFICTACKGMTPPVTAVETLKPLPSVSKQFACLPADAAFIAAHRGTSKNSIYPENSMSGLLALIDKGYIFAEIDIAAINDGTHMLYHDDTWDEKSSGTGDVNATTDAFKTIRLKDTSGNQRSDAPPLLRDILKASKDKIYLEIDFKRSAKYETVITAIQKEGLSDQVILIAYSAAQASKLARLAPDMMISISAKTDAEIRSYEQAGVKPSNMAVWRGRSGVNSKLLETLREEGIPVLRLAPTKNPKRTAKVANLIVTDHAFSFDPIIGLTRKSKSDYQNCLEN